MSRTTRVLIITCVLAACSKREEAKEDRPLGETVPAQITRGEQMREPSRDSTRPPAPAPAPAPTPAGDELSDAQIASVASTANEAEIAAAKLALSKTQNREVKAFAEMMVKDHTAANDQAKALLQKLDMMAEESDLSRTIQTDARSAAASLEGVSGADFDRAYVQLMVKDHQLVLDTLDDQLIRQADSADLAKLLTSVRPVVAAHLEHARELEARLP